MQVHRRYRRAGPRRRGGLLPRPRPCRSRDWPADARACPVSAGVGPEGVRGRRSYGACRAGSAFARRADHAIAARLPARAVGRLGRDDHASATAGPHRRAELWLATAYVDDWPKPRRIREPDRMPTLKGLADIVIDPARAFDAGPFPSAAPARPVPPTRPCACGRCCAAAVLAPNISVYRRLGRRLGLPWNVGFRVRAQCLLL